MWSFIRSLRLARAFIGFGGLSAMALGLTSCGGGGSNPLGNPPLVENPAGVSGQKLSFPYFQRCVNPIFLASLTINQGGVISTNTCAGLGCHDNTSGAGGAFRVISAAAILDVTNPANTPDVIRASDMYKNFYSAQGSTIVGSPPQSRLFAKPLLLNVLHGGGVIFADATDPNAQTIQYWINHPVPLGQDEFSTANYSMFTGSDPVSGACISN